MAEKHRKRLLSKLGGANLCIRAIKIAYQSGETESTTGGTSYGASAVDVATVGR